MQYLCVHIFCELFEVFKRIDIKLSWSYVLIQYLTIELGLHY